MKRLRYAVLILLVTSALLLGVTTLINIIRKDNTLPHIEVPEETLVLSVEDHSGDAILSGLTAWDGKDGDLTSHIMMQNVTLQEEQKMKVTYAVVDSDNHVAEASRIVEYYDYISPRFSLKSPLCYTTSSTIRIKDRLKAEDMLDGDISDRVKVDAKNLVPQYEGVYPVSFEVTNSLGDTSSITLNVTIRPSVVGEPIIRLREYLIYINSEDEFKAKKYLLSVKEGDTDIDANVIVELPQDGFKKGVNEVTYRCMGTRGIEGSTVLFVVME